MSGGEQDQAALAAFGELASGPAVIEGGRSKAGLVASAACAIGRGVLAVARGVGIALTGTAVVAGAVAGGISVWQDVHAVPPRGEGLYGGIVAEMQAEADALLGPGAIVVYDRSAPRDWENTRVAAHLGWRPGSVAKLPDKLGEKVGGGAYATWSGSGNVCIVMGPGTVEPAKKFFVGWWSGAGPTELGDVTDEVMLTATFGHEVGHCLGMNEGQADAFSALLVAKQGKSKDFLPLMMVSRELDQYTVKGDKDHITDPSLRHVMERLSDPAFAEKVRNASFGQLADIAKSVPSLDATPERQAKLRDTLYDLGAYGVYYVVPVEEGFMMTGQREWLRVNSSVPEFGRMLELADYMTADPATRVVPDAFVVDEAASAKAITDVAATGDPMAARLAPLLGGTAPEKGGQLAPVRYRAHEVSGDLVAFDRSSSTVSFAKDLIGFAIKDSASGKVAASGTVGSGILKTFGTPEQQADLEHDPIAAAVRS